MNPVLNLYDNDTVKWEHEGVRYCAHIQQDNMNDSPRDWDNMATMACWHRNYSLGDKLDDKTPEDFWHRMVRENVPREDVFEAALNGKLKGIRLQQNEESPDLYDIYETSYWRTIFGGSEPSEYLEFESVRKEGILDYLEDDLSVGHCMTLLESYAEWLPLWLYDHSGITMSCGARCGQYADQWDSGQVGWIFVTKDRMMKEVWGHDGRPLTDGNWRGRADEIMRGEVETYDQYLTGDVYGFTLYEIERESGLEDEITEEDLNEIDSCWGFYGSDISESGLADQIGCGLEEAISRGEYEVGEAVQHTCHYYTF